MAMKACFIYTELDEKKMRNKFDIEPQLERTLDGRGRAEVYFPLPIRGH
jgi:hypothetical protein